MESLRFIDLFAGMGGFHRALSSLGHECVFASEIDDEMRELYELNYPHMRKRVFGDIRAAKSKVPRHDVLCAGFPCQPFSKSGGQLGLRDRTRGTLFHEILDILRDHTPKYVILENVGNFERHDGGRTWSIVQEELGKLGYAVRGTEHLTPRSRRDWRDVGLNVPARPRRTRGPVEPGTAPIGLLSPHHFGHPHHRERFFIVASLGPLPEPSFPTPDRGTVTSLADVVIPRSELESWEVDETRITDQQRACVEHWNALIRELPPDVEPPSFPLWGDELGARYPYSKRSPWATSTTELRRALAGEHPPYTRKAKLLASLPSYAREEVEHFRAWKIRFIRQNRNWWAETAPHLPAGWRERLVSFPPSLRKLEWNVREGERDLWRYVLQFRPSGLRVKRYTSCPALVAMTDTQIPLLGPERRFLTRREGLALQGFPATHKLPQLRARAFKALGNAVHVDVVRRIADHLLSSRTTGVGANTRKQEVA